MNITWYVHSLHFLFDIVVAPFYQNTDLSIQHWDEGLANSAMLIILILHLVFQRTPSAEKSRHPFELKLPKDCQKVLSEFPVSKPSFCGVSMRKISTMSSTQSLCKKDFSQHRATVGFTHTDPSVSLRSLAHLASSLLIGSRGISVDGMAPGWLFNSDQLTLVN